MKKILISLTVLLLGFNTLSVSAYNLYMEDKENQNNNPNVDKFQPTSGVKVKPSPLAQMMENATKNTMQKKQPAQNNNTQNQQQKKINNSNYSWF